MCLKRLRTAEFRSFEPFCLYRLMGVSVPSLHRESTDSDMVCVCVHDQSIHEMLRMTRQGNATQQKVKATQHNLPKAT